MAALKMAIFMLLSASSMKLIGLLVGCAMTLANASSDAPGGMRLSPSGRARLRGSSAMLTIQISGNSTVNVMNSRIDLQDELPAQRQPPLAGRPLER